AKVSNAASGTILTNQIPNVMISTSNSSQPAMIFDTSNPTGGDDDLGTPHQDFGGPGHGDGGAAGEIGENSIALGNVIIISEDGDSSDPDDNANGGQIIFTFTDPVTVGYIYMLDQDNNGVAATVELYDAGNSVIETGTVVVPSSGDRAGDNGVYRIDFNTSDVYKMVFNLPGSGAVAAISCTETTAPSDNSSDNTPIGETPEDDVYTPECGEYQIEILEPREDNAQHVMVEYPVVCDDQGNIIEGEPGAGVSNMTVSISNDAYISANISGNLNGVFAGWCVDYENPIYTDTEYTADNYEDIRVSVDRPQNLPVINWLINYNWQANGYEVMDVQGAIWLLIDSHPINRSDIGDRAEELAQLAIATAGDDNTDPTINIVDDSSDDSSNSDNSNNNNNTNNNSNNSNNNNNGTPPTVSINYNCDDTSCNFWSSFQDDGWQTATLWDFGDGTTATSNGSHTFDYGDYTVTLTMTDNDGLTGTATLNLSFVDLPDPEMRISNLEAQGYNASGTNWYANVWVTIVNESGNPVQNATLGANFSRGGYKQCTTNSEGRCQLISNNINSNQATQVTLTINSVWGGQHAPFNRNDSVTSVTISKP
ncbi:MAG: PKD domain-containing protein, partial [Chloroflexota bacterium]